MTGPLALVIILTMITPAIIWARHTADGTHAATTGATKLPAKGLARFFYLIGFRVHMRRMTV